MSDSSLPAISQRPQLLSRFELPALQTQNADPTQKDISTVTMVEGTSTKVVPRSNFIRDVRFTQESSVQQLRGETQGRNVDNVRVSQELSVLPSQVQAFDPLTAQGNFIQSLNPAEAAAVGSIKPNQGEAFTPPPISGSGEVFNEKAREVLDSFKVDQSPEEENVPTEVQTQKEQEETQIFLDEKVKQNIQDENQKQNTVETRLQENNIVQNNVEQKSQDDRVFTQKESESKAEESTKQQSVEELSLEQQAELTQLQKRDREVRNHEQAHVAAGAEHIRGGVQYQYTQGPDGKRYVVDGEVDIDMGSEASPEATIAKMQQVKRAALAPSNPSGADRAVAAAAGQREQQARAELAEQRANGVKQRTEENRVRRGEEQIQSAENDAESTQGIDSGESLAGSQSVDAPKVDRPAVNDQRNLDIYSSYPLSSPDALFNRSVEKSTSVRAEPQTSETQTKSLENASEGYNSALNRALSSFTDIED